MGITVPAIVAFLFPFLGGGFSLLHSVGFERTCFWLAALAAPVPGTLGGVAERPSLAESPSSLICNSRCQ